MRDAPTDSVEEKHKSQKKGLFSFGTAHPAKKDSKDESSKLREKEEQDGAILISPLCIFFVFWISVFPV